MASESGGSIKEITKFNFETAIVEVIELMKMADFVAIDASVEVCGKLMEDEKWPDLMKDVNDCFGSWYDAIKDEEKTNFLIEVGIAIFKRIPGKPGELEADIYNIPVLPAVVDDNEIARFRGRTGPRLTIDGYGVQFIKSVQYDMNKPFYKAAPYLNKNLREVADDYMTQNPKFMVAVRKRRLNPHLMPDLFPFVNDVHRRAIVDRLKGVSKLFEAISELGIPVVGHHLLLKLMFIYKDFFEFLPDTYPEYYDKMTKTFKIFYDTKRLARDLSGFPKIGSDLSSRLAGPTLYDIFRNVNSNCSQTSGGTMFTVTLAADAELYRLDILDLMEGKLIEKDRDSYCYVPGFDALVSGLLFLDLVNHMEVFDINCWPPDESMTTTIPRRSLITDDEEPYLDYLDMFLKGMASRFMNKVFDEPKLPERRCDAFEVLTFEKKKRLLQRVQEERKRKLRANTSLKLFAQSLPQMTP